MENRNLPEEKNKVGRELSNNKKTRPESTVSVGVARSPSQEARMTRPVPTAKQIARRNRKASRLVPVRYASVVETRHKKKKSPLPVAVIFAAVILTLLFLFMIMNYAEIDKYNTEIAEIRANITDLKREADTLQGQLDKKESEITGMQDYIEEELGMVKGDTLPKEYISLLPEDSTTVIERSRDENGFGVLLSGIGEALRNFFNN